MGDFLNTLWNSLLVAIVPLLIPILVAFGTIVAMYFLSKKKENISTIKSALEILRLLLGNKFGDDADKVFNVWLDCLDHVQKGEWTEDQMLKHFFEIIDQLKHTTFTFSHEERQTITEVSKASIQMLSTKSFSVQSLR